MGVEDILKSNDIIFLTQTIYLSEESVKKGEKSHLIYFQNNKLNIIKCFGFVNQDRAPSAEDILFSWFVNIAVALIETSEFIDPENNSIKDPEAEYFKLHGRSLKKYTMDMTSLKRDLEDVLGDSIADILGYIATSKKDYCRRYAAFFPQCPKEAIKKILAEESDWVREFALKHPHAKDLKVFI